MPRNRARKCVRIPGLSGFSLVELAIAIFVITLLLGSILVPLSTQVAQRKNGETQKALEDIRQALLGFALAYGYLPCPDTDNDGLENVSGSNCTNSEGNLPFATLGVTGYDSWGNWYHYRVDSKFSQRAAVNRFSLSTLGDTSAGGLQVCSIRSCTCTTSSLTTCTDGPPAVVLSYGPNGYGAINATSGSANPAPTGLDELENTNGDFKFVSRTAADVGSGAGEFDDIVVWLSREVLLNRMVAAGRLP
jgi:type II secretory pathway pseudopilin PulG